MAKLSSIRIGMLVAVLAVTGCSSSTSPSSGTTELEGTWKAGCDVTGAASSQLRSVAFSGSTATFSLKYFSDQTCGTLASTLVLTSSFAIGDAVTTPVNGKKINFTESTATVTAADAAGATYLNGVGGASANCSLTGWTAGQTRDVSATACATFGDVNLAVPVAYQVYTLSGTSLYFGQNNGASTDGSSDAKRPTSVSTSGSHAYAKQ